MSVQLLPKIYGILCGSSHAISMLFVCWCVWCGFWQKSVCVRVGYHIKWMMLKLPSDNTFYANGYFLLFPLLPRLNPLYSFVDEFCLLHICYILRAMAILMVGYFDNYQSLDLLRSHTHTHIVECINTCS